MSKTILPGSTIGIIGGKHISRMLAIAAKQMGLRVVIIDPDKECPASPIVDRQIISEINDEIGLLELSNACDVITYEYESVDSTALDYLEKIAYIPQGTMGLSVTQDRILEREFLDLHLVNIAPYELVIVISDIKQAINKFGYPCVVKSARRNPYEENNIVISSEADIDRAVPLIQQGACIVEPILAIKRELFMSIGLNRNGEYTLFPIVETISDSDSEFNSVVAFFESDDVTEDLKNQIYLIAKAVASELNVSGVVGIELFLTEEDNLYVNEVSARPHDSSLYTIDGCNFSEYDVHIRGLCNWKLPEIWHYLPSVTFNVTNRNLQLITSLINKKPNWHFHFYERKESEIEKLYGHVTVVTEDLSGTLEELKSLEVIN
ncbi:5-(carboxyamino)imidazole ribonucleotide synthase [Vagococcus vulneris]|uniref:ATP-grasp domain-containing protein n=1 Tax=Vagococcus vulneris TaxID=1977869 RepID=A0A429ZXX5_9ENTE|nr:ATP-grasp domain-containing protein [Vagococcus vulneris]RST98761.1 hypothetical protein CBF37_06860 [Vagococcus vulneris]